MGLIKTAIDSIKGTLADQDKTAINCQDMGNHILMVKKTNPNGIIRDGSKVIVNAGQMAVLVDNGRVIDATAEQGVFNFKTDAAPTFFSGKFGAVFKEMWTRFSFGGASYQDQAIYFLNVKEIIDNGFGTPAPVMYRDWEHCMSNARMPGKGVPMRVAIRCSGNYTFQIDRPDVFLKMIGGNAAIYQKDELCDQMRLEIISCFQAVLNSLCSETYMIYPLDLPGQSFFIKQLMDQQVFDAPIRNRGMKISGFNVVSVDLDAESKKKIDEYELSGDIHAQQAKLNDAVVYAAQNEAGTGVGFNNLNIMNHTLGSMHQNTNGAVIVNPAFQQSAQGMQNLAYQQPVQSMQNLAYQQPAQGIQNPSGQVMSQVAVCTKCGSAVSGKFCAACGTPVVQTVQTASFCTNCGTKVNGRFCTACGTPV